MATKNQRVFELARSLSPRQREILRVIEAGERIAEERGDPYIIGIFSELDLIADAPKGAGPGVFYALTEFGRLVLEEANA